ncbi:MAG TPA: substrate-binding domain-containing protein [Jiangellaceae bacterium]|nr:substrate-binding domain-containing protein [Jiangellaceae bacterium]
MASKRKGFSWIALVAALGLVLAACGDDDDGGTAEEGTESPAAGGEGSIWVLLPDTESSDRWEEDDRRYFAENFEAAGLVDGEDFTIVNAEGDATTQQSQAEQAINDGASVIVLTSLDTGSGATIIDQATEADVQVLEYDRFNTGGAGGAAYVSFDNVKVGATMAEVLEPAIDELGLSPVRVVELNGGEEDNNSFLFKSGYDATVQERVSAGDWELVADQHVPGWDNQEALTIMEQILVDQANGVDAVFAANDGLAASAANAIEAAGIGPLPISGQDATAEGMQNVLLGRQTMSVYKPIQNEAGLASAVALALRAGEDILTTDFDFDYELIGIEAETGQPTDSPEGDGVVPYFGLVPIGVTEENIADTVIADGFRTVEEICTGDVAATTWCQENAG